MFLNQVTWKDMMKNFEASWRGEITFESFWDTLLDLGIVDTATGLESIFWKYDSNKSGTLDPQEFLNKFELQSKAWKVSRPK